MLQNPLYQFQCIRPRSFWREFFKKNTVFGDRYCHQAASGRADPEVEHNMTRHNYLDATYLVASNRTDSSGKKRFYVICPNWGTPPQPPLPGANVHAEQNSTTRHAPEASILFSVHSASVIPDKKIFKENAGFEGNSSPEPIWRGESRRGTQHDKHSLPWCLTPNLVRISWVLLERFL